MLRTLAFLCFRLFGVCFFGGLRLSIGLIALVLFTSSITHAHGGGAPQLTNADAGPYRLFAWTQPEPWRAGEVHISVGVTLPPAAGTTVDEGVTNNALDTPVTDAIVVVTLTPANGVGQSLTVEALPLEQLGSLYYEADAILPTAGEWRVRVDVTGPEGHGSADFVTQVLPARSNKMLYALGGLVAALLALVTFVGLGRGRTQA